MAPSASISIIDRVRRAGCWAVGLYAFAVFFIFGGVISLANTDIVRAAGGFVLAAVALGGGIWLARRAASAPAPAAPAARPRPRPRKRT